MFDYALLRENRRIIPFVSNIQNKIYAHYLRKCLRKTIRFVLVTLVNHNIKKTTLELEKYHVT